MRVVFVEREHGPERLVCEAEILFEAESGQEPELGPLEVQGAAQPGPFMRPAWSLANDPGL